MVPFIKSFILADLNDDVKFRNYTYWSTNDTRTHHLSCQVSNRHSSNKNLIFMSHVKISLYGNSLCKGVPLFFPYIVHILSNKDVHDTSDDVMCGYPWPSNEQRAKCVLDVFNPCSHSHVRKLNVKSWIKSKWKHNVKVKIKCVINNEQIYDLIINHSLVPLNKNECEF